jgi:predicted kinase
MIKISQRDMPIFIMTIGISGSGKSTWINQQTSSGDIIVVCPDLIREELTGSISDQTQNPKVWSITKQRVMEALGTGKSVILDATNVDSKQRKQFIQGLPTAILKAKIFNVDPQEAKNRVRKAIESGENRSNVPDFIIDKQHEKFKLSTPEILKQEGFELL